MEPVLKELIEGVQKDFDEFREKHFSAQEKLKARTDELESRLNAPIPTGGLDTKSCEGKREKWETTDGHECVALYGKSRLATGAEPYAVGKVLQSIITGRKSEFTKAQVVGSDASGGYLLSDNLQAGFIDLARDASVLSSAGVGTITLPGGESQGKLLKISGSDPVGGWTAELQNIPEDDISLALHAYRLRKYGVLIELSREFVDTPNGPAMIEQVVRAALAGEMDRVALLGSGAGEEPSGISNTAGIGSITGVGDINYDDFLNAIKTVRNANYDPTGAIYSPGTEYELAVLKSAVELQYLQPPVAFNSMPKYITKKCTDALAFVGQWNMAAWVLGGGGIRVEIGTAASSFKRDSVYLRAIMPMDFVVFDAGAFCKLSGLS